jgi:hypothetical protein
MGKKNLADAAKAVLMNEGAKEIFDASVARGHKESGTKLPTSVAYGMKDAGEVAGVVDKKDDPAGDYTKGVPTATPPGATPPVGSEPAHKLENQPQETQGAEHTVSQEDPTSYENIRDRIKAKLAKQTMQANPGATFQSYAEEVETEEEEVVAEEKEKEEGHEDEAQDKAMIKKMMKKEKMKEEMDSDVNALLSGENLSEEFKTKATTIFESAVVARTQALVEEIEEAMVEEFELAVEEVKNELAQKLDDYIGYMAEEWVKDNQLAIEKGLRAEIVEDFIGGLKDLFIEHYIDIPEEKVDVVEELTTKVEELEGELNEQIQSAVELRKELNEHKKIEAIHAVCEGLTQTQVEKMKTLAEGVEFTTDEEYAEKLVTLRTSYFTESVKPASSSALNEEVVVEEEKKQTVSSDPTIAAIASAISKTVVK